MRPPSPFPTCHNGCHAQECYFPLQRHISAFPSSTVLVPTCDRCDLHFINQKLRCKAPDPLATVTAESSTQKKGKKCNDRVNHQQSDSLVVRSRLGGDFGLLSLLKSCAKEKDVVKIDKIQDDILVKGLIEKDIYVANTLISLYGKCGSLEKAKAVFNRIPVRDVVSWTALISGYARNDHDEDALNCFQSMQREGLSPNAVTFVCILKACGRRGAINKGREIHVELEREGLLENNILLGTALVDMYARCGALSKAQEVFDLLPVRNVVSWTVLIAGYAQCGHGGEALFCFEHMQHEGLSPDSVTFLSLLKACGTVGTADKGEEIHGKIVKRGLLDRNTLIGPALVDMYSKCGALARAQEVFDQLEVQNIVSWNSLIAGYAQVGKDDTVIDLFNRMIEGGIEPDFVTFTVVLNACSHSGLVDQGQICFDTMNTCYAIVPTLEHQTCMIDLFARAGHFEKVVAMIKKMPASDYLPVWATLLGACRNWGNVNLGRIAFQHAVLLDPRHAPAYVSMRNIYAAAGMQEAADEIDALRLKNKAWITEQCDSNLQIRGVLELEDDSYDTLHGEYL